MALPLTEPESRGEAVPAVLALPVPRDASFAAVDSGALLSWLAKNAVAEDDAADDQVEDPEAADSDGDQPSDAEAFREAAE